MEPQNLNLPQPTSSSTSITSSQASSSADQTMKKMNEMELDNPSPPETQTPPLLELVNRPPKETQTQPVQEHGSKYSSVRPAVSPYSRKLFACSLCDKKFSTSMALGGHQNGHKSERLANKRQTTPFQPYPSVSHQLPLYHPGCFRGFGAFRTSLGHTLGRNPLNERPNFWFSRNSPSPSPSPSALEWPFKEPSSAPPLFRPSVSPSPPHNFESPAGKRWIQSLECFGQMRTETMANFQRLKANTLLTPATPPAPSSFEVGNRMHDFFGASSSSKQIDDYAGSSSASNVQIRDYMGASPYGAKANADEGKGKAKEGDEEEEDPSGLDLSLKL